MGFVEQYGILCLRRKAGPFAKLQLLICSFRRCINAFPNMCIRLPTESLLYVAFLQRWSHKGACISVQPEINQRIHLFGGRIECKVVSYPLKEEEAMPALSLG